MPVSLASNLTLDESVNTPFETDHEISAIFGSSDSMALRTSTPEPTHESYLLQSEESSLNISPQAPADISLSTPSPPNEPTNSPVLAVATCTQAPTDVSMTTPSPPHMPSQSPTLTVDSSNEAPGFQTASTSGWFGFRIVGDNIDKNVKPRDMRSDHQTQSLHYFNSFAILDRVDLSHYSSSPLRLDPAELDPIVFLPSKEDYDALEDNMNVLISRVIVQYMSFFKDYGSIVIRHIDHPHSDEMSNKSTVVGCSLCVAVGGPLGSVLRTGSNTILNVSEFEITWL